MTLMPWTPAAVRAYHTNVLMAIGTGFAVVCGGSIANDAHRATVLSKLRATGHEVVDISPARKCCISRRMCWN